MKSGVMEEIELVSKSLEETLSIGRIIGEQADSGKVVALIGELGAGKTSITQGIAEGLGVPDAYYVTSPTFTLINEYPGRLPLYHFDVYRLSGSHELDDLGYEDYFFGEGLVVIEWAEKLMESLPDNTLFIHMDRLNDDNERRLRFSRRSGSEVFGSLKEALEKGGYL
ncbi:MAG: tRNA (adenosine(37)-N6)-threonylcarbamoyltransferase complex ATPase subunit type 1 TsaE [Syntrophales bacterium]|nr:tRNA (adenosine(37)-N6)-threonylcarbamoyltransferase complex ATPase subunit type 1 TsaE [Syntrophales bacterium]